MRAYLDICALKRPFDDHAQPRVRLEANAVLEVLAAPPERVTFVHSRAHDLENRHNPIPWRAASVSTWLQSAEMPADPKPDDLVRRTGELMALGFRNFDAFHVASAELAGAEVFASTDDRLLRLADRHAASLRVRVVDVVTLAR
ncbi:MAG: PIN domain-containing protein, partial [Candidatus Rokuibacteriota bacterium]